MSQETSTVVTPSAPPAPSPAGKRHKRGHPVRNTVIALVVIAALVVGGIFLYRFLNKPAEVNSTLRTGVAEFGNIQSSVQGSGSARAKESAAISLQNAGIVQKVYVTAGQMVMEGEPLYEVVSPAAQEAYDSAVSRLEKARQDVKKQQDALLSLQKDLATLQGEYQSLVEAQARSASDRFVKAPFAGQLQETTRFQVGDDVAAGTKIATLVDDARFRVTLYFSYAYEGKIAPGQAATVVVNGSALPGTVEEVAMVRRVSPEGGLLFEATVVVHNPGAFTKGMSATATLTGADGVAIYPYDAGALDYYRTAEVLTKTTGSVLSTGLRDYADVKEGQVILSLSEEDFTRRFEEKNAQIMTMQDQIKAQAEAITAAENTVEEAEQRVADAQKALDDFSAVAPISGTVTSCTLVEGQEVKNGDTVITISNNTTMIVTITVDDRNIAYVKPGMGVELQSNWGGGGSFYGVVTKIDMSFSDSSSIGSGMTNYPVTLEVDNWDGSLLEGMWLSYSFVTSQSDNCIIVPMQSVRYVSLPDGETASVVFVQVESKPENAVELELPETMPGQAPMYPAESDGFYPVPVSTGLSDNYNVEITEGLMGGETVFVSYLVNQASIWG